MSIFLMSEKTTNIMNHTLVKFMCQEIGITSPRGNPGKIGCRMWRKENKAGWGMANLADEQAISLISSIVGQGFDDMNSPTAKVLQRRWMDTDASEKSIKAEVNKMLAYIGVKLVHTRESETIIPYPIKVISLEGKELVLKDQNSIKWVLVWTDGSVIEGKAGSDFMATTTCMLNLKQSSRVLQKLLHHTLLWSRTVFILRWKESNL
jgi:hypothetical protein